MAVAWHGDSVGGSSVAVAVVARLWQWCWQQLGDGGGSVVAVGKAWKRRWRQ